MSHITALSAALIAFAVSGCLVEGETADEEVGVVESNLNDLENVGMPGNPDGPTDEEIAAGELEDPAEGEKSKRPKQTKSEPDPEPWRGPGAEALPHEDADPND